MPKHPCRKIVVDCLNHSWGNKKVHAFLKKYQFQSERNRVNVVRTHHDMAVKQFSYESPGNDEEIGLINIYI